MQQMNSFKWRCGVIALIVSLRLSLDLGYTIFVSQVFDYDGFVLEFDLTRYILSWAALFFILFIFCLKLRAQLVYIYFLLFVAVIIPGAVYYAIGGGSSLSFWVNFLIFSALISFLPTLGRASDEFANNIPQKKTVVAVVIFVMIIIGYLIFNSGGKYIIDIGDVYAFREENLDAYSGVFGYLINWGMKVAAPFLLAVALLSKGKVKIVGAALIILLLFVFSGHKSALLPIALCVFAYIFIGDPLRRKSGVFFVWLPAAVLLLAIACLIDFFIFDNLVLSSVFLRRTFFTPAFLNSVYFEFFQTSRYVFLSNSFLAPFITYPYSDTVTHEVGAYLGRYGMGANTGFVASGFMQAGLFGSALYFLIVMFLNKAVSLIGRQVEPIIFNSVLFMPFLTLFSSSDLPTTILTHGLGFAILLLVFYGWRVRFR